MLHTWTLKDLKLQGAWLTIGSFDGVHRGHQEILGEIIHQSHALDFPAVALTFFPHPADVLGKRNGAFYLSSPEEKVEIMADLGLDYLITHPFNQKIASISARDFILALKKQIRFDRLFVGVDFALGRNREGDLSQLTQLGKELDFSVQTIEPVRLNGRIISSSWVRDALAEGDLALANDLLGRPFSLQGEVIRGDDRGKALGFPTANLEVWEKHILPRIGVYAGLTRVLGEMKPSVINIGFRPTFENNSERPRVEAHILDYEREIYGRQVTIFLIQRLRDERRFSGVDALIDQVHEDILEARRILEVNSDVAVSRLTSTTP
jgi:riboflavin kinase / FMN adenylyltransferase